METIHIKIKSVKNVKNESESKFLAIIKVKTMKVTEYQYFTFTYNKSESNKVLKTNKLGKKEGGGYSFRHGYHTYTPPSYLNPIF